MKVKQAIEILETHNKWRRGDDTIQMLKPKDIGIAIDVVIEYVNDSSKLIIELLEDANDIEH